MSGVRRNEHVPNNKIYTNLTILKIEEVYFLEIAKFMHLYHHNKLPELFSPYFNVTKNIHPHTTKSTTRKNYFVPHVNSNSAKKSYFLWELKFGTALLLNGRNILTTNFKKL